MSSVITRTDAPTDVPSAPHHRRSREEMEALAKNFVATPVEEPVAPAKSRALLMAGVAGAVAVAGIVAFLAWPSGKAETAARTAEASRAAAEVEELRQRMEAERERKRKELAAGSDYLERIAQADAATVKDLSAQADKLADRAAAQPTAQSAAQSAAPATSDAPPTPRDGSKPVATSAAAPATPTQPKAVATMAAATMAPQPKPAAQEAAPAKAEPTQVAQAAPSDCKIHVSELSSSGKLTYESIRKMKGARIDESNGHVFTPPVPAAGGRTVVFEVQPDGCVKVGRR